MTETPQPAGTDSDAASRGAADTASVSEKRRLVEDVVRPSFARCCVEESEFFDDFYVNLSDRLPVVGSMFARVDMKQQNKLISVGVANLIAFAGGDAEAEREMNRLAKSHSRSGLGIAPDFYPHWIDALMETVHEHDTEVTDDTQAAWRDVLSDGIELLIAGY
jgi:hemoglobin-like flavoprotein